MGDRGEHQRVFGRPATIAITLVAAVAALALPGRAAKQKTVPVAGAKLAG